MKLRIETSVGPKVCSRCGRDSKLEKHHVIFRSEGGSNLKKNLVWLCKDCHDFIHAETSILRGIERYWKKLDYWGHRTERSVKRLNKMNYQIQRIRLLEKRLNVARTYNSIDNIKINGYRSYWQNTSTHGGRS